MTRTFLRAGLGAVAAVVCVLACTATASAGNHRYCNSLVQPHTPCSIEYTQQILLNKAYYLGAGSVSVCQRAVIYGGGQVSRRCSTGDANSIDSDYDLYPYYEGYVWLTVTCGNNSSYAHTILCEALWNSD